VADLHPTKTRLELLRAVQRGQVFRYDYGFGYEPSFWEPTRGGKGLKVRDRIESMRIAGWVRFPGFPGEGPRVCRWELTPAGKAVLERHPEFRPKEEQEQQR
jgi:hypothetical protein